MIYPATARYWPPVRLRPLSADDAQMYRALYTDPSVMAHLGGPLDAARADAHFRLLLERMAQPDRHYAVLHGDDPAACGLAAIRPDRPLGDSAEIGLMLLPCAQRRDIGEPAMLLLVDAAFSVSAIARLRVEYAVAHVAAGQLARRIGFELGQTPVGARTENARRRAWLARERWEHR